MLCGCYVLRDKHFGAECGHQATNAAALPASGGLGAIGADLLSIPSQTVGFLDALVGREAEIAGDFLQQLAVRFQDGGQEMSAVGNELVGFANSTIASETVQLNDGFNGPTAGLLLGDITATAPTGLVLQNLGSVSQFLGSGLSQTGTDLFDFGIGLVASAF